MILGHFKPVHIKLTFALCKSSFVIALNLHNVLQVAQLVVIALPRKFLISPHRNRQSTYGQMGGPKLEEFVLDQRYVQQVRGVEQNPRLTDRYSPAVILQKGLRWATVYIEANDSQYFALHGAHFRRLKRILGHLDEIRHDRRINLLKLRRDKHGRNAKKLELVQGDFLLAQVAIDDVDGDEEGFRQQVELHLDYDKPIDQYFALVSRYFPVKAQVVASWHESGLDLGHPDMNFVTI